MLADERNSLVQRFHRNPSRPILAVLHPDAPRLTADLAIFDVLLNGSPTRIEGDLDRLIAVWAINGGCCFSRSVAEGEVGVLRFFVG